MGELAKSNSNQIIGAMHHAVGAIDLPRPYERDIFLFETHIAGTTHIPGIEELEPILRLEDRLEFLREPANNYDEMAIVIHTENGVKLGYVPRDDNAIFARLMDAGKLLFARVATKETIGSWRRIGIHVYLHD